jgi:hypothetical protein
MEYILLYEKSMKGLRFVGKIVAFLKPIVKYPTGYLSHSDFGGNGELPWLLACSATPPRQLLLAQPHSFLQSHCVDVKTDDNSII